MLGLERELGDDELSRRRQAAHCGGGGQRPAAVPDRRNGAGRRTRRRSVIPCRTCRPCIWWWSRRRLAFRLRPRSRDGMNWSRAKPELTGTGAAGTINKFGQGLFAWLSESVFSQAASASEPASGVPAVGGDRAETLLLDLVRAGIENDFERVVFPEYPELREVKRVLQREGARYASLSGSGSTLYGLFASGEEAQAAAGRMSAPGHAAVATTTLTRDEYWQQMVVASGQWLGQGSSLASRKSRLRST